MVTLHTSLGDITLELDAERAPKTVENFLRYAREGFYAGTIFHRVIDGFMVQGGGMTADMKEMNTNEPVENEANNGLKNVMGSVAMARTNDPHSATAQFFINVGNNKFLDHTEPTRQGWGYAVFGKIVDGMAVVDSIRKVATGKHGFHDDVPKEAIVIERVTVVDADPAPTA